MMGIRSDRRFLNLSCSWALQAFHLTRRRADFHRGPERPMKLLNRRIYGRNRLHSHPANYFSLGAGSHKGTGLN